MPVSAGPPTYYESNLLSRKWRKGLASAVSKTLPDGWEEMRHLDVGVGDGYTIRLVKPEGEIHGVDFDPAEVELAVSRGVQATVGTAYRTDFPDGAFELVTLLEVIEHLERPLTALEEIHRVLAPGGFLVVSTPVPGLVWDFTWHLWTAFGPGRRWRKIPHVSEMRVGDASSPGTLAALLKQAGFEVLTTRKANLGFVAAVLARKAR